MVDTEKLYFDHLRPEEMEHERPLFAYEMTRTHLRNNQAFLDGNQPVDAQGEPIQVSYKSDAQIQELVTQAYGLAQPVLEAIQAAYAQHYKELLERSN